MPTYVTFLMTVHDADEYEKYKAGAGPLALKYGAKYLTRGQPIQMLEGEDYSGRLVILEYPNRKAFDDFYNSEEYAPIKAIRQACSTSHYMMVQDTE